MKMLMISLKMKYLLFIMNLPIAEMEGLKELLQLAYYHQIFDDIFEVKFV